MSYIKFECEKLKSLCYDAFCKIGFSAKESEIITDVLILADLYGIKSHGTQRLARYYKGIVNKTINLDAKPEIVFETPFSAWRNGTANWSLCNDFGYGKSKKSRHGNGFRSQFRSLRNCRLLY